MTAMPTPTSHPALALAGTLACLSLTACASTPHHTTATSGAAPHTSNATTPETTTTAASSSAGLTGQTVARVGPYPITKAAVEHWMTVMIATGTSDIPKTSDPKLVVPQPPSYTTCITNAKEGLAHTSSHPTLAAIKEKCGLLHQALTEQAVELLISTSQLIGESTEHGITASDSEIRQQLNRLKSEEFPNDAAFRRYLHITRQSLADQLYRVKELLLTSKLLASIAGAPNHTPTPAQQQAFTPAVKRWTAATSCRTGYVVARCNQYKPTTASKPPISVILAELAL
jgi:hypothetical protein